MNRWMEDSVQTQEQGQGRAGTMIYGVDIFLPSPARIPVK
jgi:hypothetical protein